MDQLITADEFVRETRHRVKNSLQLVASMLAAQARQAGDEAVVKGLREAIRRITAAAHLHEQLQYKETGSVDVAEYLRDICNDLVSDDVAEHCEVRLDVEHTTMEGPEALALGLIVNELVTNARQHAYGDGFGTIDVRLRRNGRELILDVADRGTGRSSSDDGLGMTFVKVLAGKLGGELSISNADPGTLVQLRLGLHELMESP